MAELRRLFIDRQRLGHLNNVDRNVILTDKESHYLTRVLRLREGSEVLLVNGYGFHWRATLKKSDLLEIAFSNNDPVEKISRQRPLICLGICVPKRGFDETIRMSTEIGIDVIQPLISERCVPKDISSSRSERWEEIVIDSLEQSERLWKPELRKTIRFDEWVNESRKEEFLSIGTTRDNRNLPFELWLEQLDPCVSHVWVAIGPEGGWTDDELYLASENSFTKVRFGDSILRTSTAAISSSQLMDSWRRNKIS